MACKQRRLRHRIRSLRIGSLHINILTFFLVSPLLGQHLTRSAISRLSTHQPARSYRCGLERFWEISRYIGQLRGSVTTLVFFLVFFFFNCLNPGTPSTAINMRVFARPGPDRSSHLLPTGHLQLVLLVVPCYTSSIAPECSHISTTGQDPILRIYLYLMRRLAILGGVLGRRSTRAFLTPAAELRIDH